MIAMTDYIKTSVLLPVSRVEEFFATYAEWLAEPAGGHASRQVDQADLTPWVKGAGSPETEAARAIWAKLSPRAKAMFALLSAHPGRRYPAAELAEQLAIPNGMFGVAGVLAWPGRHAAAQGYHLPVEFEPGETGQGATYWMDPSAASCFAPLATADGP
jgi:Family of unknown function (DUF6416)